jgi:membrane-bound acyltransferase YfiQ involved in biofilm formation
MFPIYQTSNSIFCTGTYCALGYYRTMSFLERWVVILTEFGCVYIESFLFTRYKYIEHVQYPTVFEIIFSAQSATIKSTPIWKHLPFE